MRCCMQNINKIRALFAKPEGEEDKILNITGKFLKLIDEKKHGTFIGKKKKIDYEELFHQASFPKYMGSENEVIESITGLYDGVGLWSHPQMQVNVVPPPTTISIAAAALAARYNENSIWDHYGPSAAQSEVIAVGMLSDLIGFDKTKAGGIFTFGGTGCNLYAARIGIEKSDPDAKHTGIRDRIHFFCSDVSHYSIKSSAIWTGVGLNNIKIIPSNDDNIMDANDRIIFYGKGMGGWRYNSTNSRWEYEGNPDPNNSHTLFPYDNVNYYLLTFNSLPGKRIPTENSPSLTDPQIPTKFTDYFHFEEDHYNILSSGLDWYWLRMIGFSDNKSTNFQLPQNLLNDSMQIKIRFKGGSGSIRGNTEYFEYTLKAIINNQSILDNLTFSKNNSRTVSFNYTTLEAVHPGNNLLQVQHTGNLNGCEVFLDYFEMSEGEFWEVVDSFRSPDIWEKVIGEWKLKFEIE